MIVLPFFSWYQISSSEEMGKYKLRSPIKAIQESIISVKPMSSCTQNFRTNSFRDDRVTIEGSGVGFSYPVISNRLFFSPCMTKSIMEEAKARESNINTQTSDDGEAMRRDLYNGSVVVVLASEDPYRDFKLSMEEMVDAHGARDWAQLEGLLLCYLRLNEERNHKFIMMAFVDLVEKFVAKLGGRSPSPSSSLSSSFPLVYDRWSYYPHVIFFIIHLCGTKMHAIFWKCFDLHFSPVLLNSSSTVFCSRRAKLDTGNHFLCYINELNIFVIPRIHGCLAVYF